MALIEALLLLPFIALIAICSASSSSLKSSSSSSSSSLSREAANAKDIIRKSVKSLPIPSHCCSAFIQTDSEARTDRDVCTMCDAVIHESSRYLQICGEKDYHLGRNTICDFVTWFKTMLTDKLTDIAILTANKLSDKCQAAVNIDSIVSFVDVDALCDGVKRETGSSSIYFMNCTEDERKLIEGVACGGSTVLVGSITLAICLLVHLVSKL